MIAKYYIDVYKLVADSIPAVIKQHLEHFQWLKAMVFPLRSLFHGEFTRVVDDATFRASLSSSVCRLEFMLNKLFYVPGLTTAYSRRIVIEKVTYREPVYIFLGDGNDPATAGGIDGQPYEENQAIPLYTDAESQPVYIYTDAELGAGGGPDFLVKIPQPEAGAIDMARFRYWLNTNILPDKEYQITTY